MPTMPRLGVVTDAEKEKIRKGEFVDFKKLIATKSRPQSTKFTISEDGIFEKIEDTSNLTFHNWLDAFIIFMSIRMEFYPTESQGLLRHLQIIKNLWGNNKNGIEYDTQFRRTKAHHPDIEWGEYLHELIVELPPKESFQEKAKPPSFRPRKFPERWCFKFNSLAGCPNSKCKYSHKCSKCFQYTHPAHKCKSR